ncbi:hypothetical protein Bpfe_022938 [Biomphalaria pfeifferi]|uniref:Uncharacterized protein n=1 Tax=Biomphalaria pfeifferi TaxID=112525 RepID=A0AAD8B594_BIOPF|nr:hypothetical protein Bpfe_022938 [Biomphalaria pfeifferi]
MFGVVRTMLTLHNGCPGVTRVKDLSVSHFLFSRLTLRSFFVGRLAPQLPEGNLVIEACFEFHMLTSPGRVIEACFEFHMLTCPGRVIEACFEFHMLTCPGRVIEACFEFHMLTCPGRVIPGHQQEDGITY